MRRLFAVLFLCVFLMPCASGDSRTINYSGGNKWVGDTKFKRGSWIPHGQGTYTWANGDKYVGEWKWDKQHGQGTYTWADGAKYVGEWKSDEPWEGIEYHPNGEIAATYSNGKWCDGCKEIKKTPAAAKDEEGGGSK